MATIERNMINRILESLTSKLERNLSADEIDSFSWPRSLMAYEMIIDYIEDLDNVREDIERYVKSVVIEHKQTR